MRLLIILGVLLVAGTAWIVWHNPERETLDASARRGIAMEFIGLSEGITGYQLGGPKDGPWVVLIHGYSVPSAQWTDTAAALQSAGYRTLHYDLYGRGWSDRPGGAYDLDRYIRQLNELLSVLSAPKEVQLVGLSMGGLIAAQFAVSHPERVSNLVLIAPFNAVADVPDILAWPVVGTVVAHAAYFPRQTEMQKRAFADPAMAERYLPLFTEQLPYKGFRRAIFSTLQTVILKDPLPVYLELGTQGREITMLWGDQDTVVPYADASRLVQALRPGATLVTIEGVGHAPHLEAPEATQAALIEALKRPEAEVEPAGSEAAPM